MTDIELYIVKLLLNNDCVIVPGLGGFIAHHIPAMYDAENHVFLPPTRVVGFNQKLSMTDTLLAQAYANDYDMSYPEALKRIEQDVNALKDALEKSNKYEFLGIGTLCMSENGQYDFQPEASGLLTPSLYGLEPIGIITIQPKSVIKQVAIATTSPIVLAERNDSVSESVNNNEDADNEETSEDDTISIPINWLRNIAAACLLLILFISFPSKLGDANVAELNKSAIDTSLLYAIMPKDITSGKPDSLKLDAVEQTSNLDKNSKEISAQPIKRYSIVLAARITKQNAESFVKQLNENGLKEARVYRDKKGVKVIYKDFDTKEEAAIQMKTLSAGGKCKGCWITDIYI